MTVKRDMSRFKINTLLNVGASEMCGINMNQMSHTKGELEVLLEFCINYPLLFCLYNGKSLI